MTDHTEAEPLEPCPFCGAGETQIVEKGRVWLGMKYGEPSSVSVQHWCDQVPGQPSRMIERVGRDSASAIAAWNTRAAPAVVSQQLTTEASGDKPSPVEAEDAKPPTTADTWPIAKLVVKDGKPTATFYTPGLPDGEHDVWPCPVALGLETAARIAVDAWQSGHMLAEAMDALMDHLGMCDAQQHQGGGK